MSRCRPAVRQVWTSSENKVRQNSLFLSGEGRLITELDPEYLIKRFGLKLGGPAVASRRAFRQELGCPSSNQLAELYSRMLSNS